MIVEKNTIELVCPRSKSYRIQAQHLIHAWNISNRLQHLFMILEELIVDLKCVIQVNEAEIFSLQFLNRIGFGSEDFCIYIRDVWMEI